MAITLYSGMSIGGTDTPLKYYLGDLYSLAKNKKCSLQKMLSIYQVKGQIYLDTHMFHPSQGLTTTFDRFYDRLNQINLSEGEDVVSWYLTSSNVFSVKSCYSMLNDGGCRSMYKKSIWKSAAPLKVNIFVWLAYHAKILSKENLH